MARRESNSNTELLSWLIGLDDGIVLYGRNKRKKRVNGVELHGLEKAARAARYYLREGCWSVEGLEIETMTVARRLRAALDQQVKKQAGENQLRRGQGKQTGPQTIAHSR